jgi:hypothetical protein
LFLRDVLHTQDTTVIFGPMKIAPGTIMIACLLVVASAACKKEKKTGGGERLYEIVSETNKKLMDYGYTADGKLSKVTNYDTTGRVLGTTDYFYTGSTVAKIMRVIGLEDSSISFLDSRGYATSIVHNYRTVFDTSLLEYDNDGYLSRAFLTPQKQDTVLFTNKEGKRLSAKRMGVLGSEDVFDYYDFKDEKQVLSLLGNLNEYGDQYSKEIFWGKPVSYALKRWSHYLKNDPAHTVVYDYEYTFNENSSINSIAVTISYKDSYELYRGRIFLHYK